MRHPHAGAAVPAVRVSMAAGAPAVGMSVVRVPAGELCNASTAPCNRRLHVFLFHLGIFVLERAYQLRPEIQLLKSGPGGGSGCGMWGPACAMAATAPEMGGTKAADTLSPDVVAALDQALQRLVTRNWNTLMRGMIGLSILRGSTSAAATAATGGPHCSEECVDTSWPITYVQLETVYIPLLGFARERLLANDVAGDHAATLSMLGVPSFKIVLEVLEDVPVFRTTTAAELGGVDDLLEKMREKCEAHIEHTRSSFREQAQVKALVRRTLYVFVLQLRKTTNLLTCSSRFHRNRLEFFFIVQQMIPRMMKFILMYFRMTQYMQLCDECPQNVRRRFKGFVESSQELSLQIQYLVYVIHGIAHGCLVGASPQFRQAYHDAMLAYTKGEPHLSAFGPLLRPPEQARKAEKTKRDQQQEGSSGDRREDGEQKQVSSAARGRGTATSSRSPGQEDSLPPLDAVAYVVTMLEHLQKVRILDKYCDERLSMCMGEDASKCATAATRMASQLFGSGGKSATVNLYGMLFPGTAAEVGVKDGALSSPSQARGGGGTDSSATDSSGGRARTDSLGATSAGHAASDADTGTAAGAAAADEAASSSASDDVCFACQALRRSDESR